MIFLSLTYNEALEEASIPTLLARREALSVKLFNDIVNNKEHKLAGLLPPKTSSYTKRLRRKRTFEIPNCNTDRFRKSFIVHYANSHVM